MRGVPSSRRTHRNPAVSKANGTARQQVAGGVPAVVAVATLNKEAVWYSAVGRSL